jgi:lauroyl/myristoyl acyltransferase
MKLLQEFRRRRRIALWLHSWLGPMSWSDRRVHLRRLIAADLRNSRLIEECANVGLGCLLDRVDWREDESLRRLRGETRPVVLAFSHLGPPLAVGPSLAKIGFSALLMHGGGAMARARRVGAAPGEPAIEYLELEKQVAGNGMALVRALMRLRTGGAVGWAVDAFDRQAGLKLRYLGREMPMGRGISYLARRGGAVVVPLLCTWTAGGRILAQVGEALEPAADDAAFTASILRWFEDQAVRSPEQVRLRHFERYIQAAA